MDYKASFTFSELKYGIFVIYVNKINWKLWGNDIDSFICIFISTINQCFMEIAKLHNILWLFKILYHIYIYFSLFWKKMFALSFKIN